MLSQQNLRTNFVPGPCGGRAGSLGQITEKRTLNHCCTAHEVGWNITAKTPTSLSTPRQSTICEQAAFLHQCFLKLETSNSF